MAGAGSTPEMDELPKAPVQLLADIFRDPDLTEEQKKTCERFLRDRFKTRRSMAWVSLAALLAVAGVKLFYPPAAEIDVVWLTTPLVVIVGSYYTTAALRPGN